MRVVVPEHVVYREFAAETVVLNLQNGQYYGLNPTAARMLAALESAGTAAGALAALAGEMEVGRERLSEDLHHLCRELADRGIIVVGDEGDG